MNELDDYKKGYSEFGDQVIVEYPKDSDLVVLASNEGFGLKPFKLLFFHQIYWKDVKDVEGLTLIPIRSSEYINLTETGSVTSGLKKRTLWEREREEFG